MKVLVIGKGGREHAIIRALKKSNRVKEIYCAPGNGGISCDAINIPINEMDKEGIKNFAQNNNINFVVVAPDNPLADGMVDTIESIGIACFGPNKKAAQIESSKVFAKKLMKKYNIPTGDYEVFDNFYKAIDYIKAKNKYPTVIKADGLALGKGVIIANNFEEAENAVKDIMVNNKFGKSGNKIIVEEFLSGPEVSVLCFTDGKTIKPMVSSMDHKRALDGDKGLNTGGMGAIAPNPAYTNEIEQECIKNIFIPTIRAMEKEGCPFSGCLYFGLMLTRNGPKVIEYNCRFGDPETQVVLPLLETDLFTIMEAISKKELEKIEVKFANKYSACVVLASPGYPESYPKGITINGLNKDGQTDDITIYHAGTILENDEFKTSGGRVLCTSASGSTLSEAIEKAYRGLKKVSFNNAHYRKDIGKKALSIISKKQNQIK